jgi:hypothetical protein
MEQFNINREPIKIDTKEIQDVASLETSITNEMQIRLALSCYPDKEDDEALETFLTNETSTRFREIINKEPELLMEYRENEGATLEKIKAKLFH